MDRTVSEILDEEPNITLKEYLARREAEIEDKKMKKERKLKEEEEKINSLLDKTFLIKITKTCYMVFHHDQPYKGDNVPLSSTKPVVSIVTNKNSYPAIKVNTNDKIRNEWLLGKDVCGCYEIPTKKYNEFIADFCKLEKELVNLM